MSSVKQKADSVRKLSGGSPWFWLILFLSLVAMMAAIYAMRFMLGKTDRVGMALAVGQKVEVLFRKNKAHARLREAAKIALEEERRLEKEARRKAEEQARIEAQSENDKAALARAKRFEGVQLGDGPVVVIIIKGLGLSATTTERALELPASVTLGFSPYAPDVKEWAALALERGNDILLNIPMETLDFRTDDPGPYALLTSSSSEDNKTRLNMLLGLVDGYVAVYSERNEIFTQNQKSVQSIISVLNTKHIPFVFGGGYDNYSLIQIANENEYPLLVTDLVLDNAITQDAINAKLKEVEEMALDKGVAIAMAHPYPITMRMIEQWMIKLEDKNITVVPVSAMIGHIIKQDKNLEDGLTLEVDSPPQQ